MPNETPSMDEAIEETRELISAMADSIRTVKGSSTTINAQDIPNEIREILGISPVIKTYYNVQSYLSDIATLLKQGSSTTINAQDFPDVILNLDGSVIMYNQLMQWDKINSNILSISDFKTFFNRANSEYGNNNWNLYATYAMRYQTTREIVSIGAVPINVVMVYGEYGYNQGVFNGCGNDWRQLNFPQANYECVAMFRQRLGNWYAWANKDDTYIGCDNNFQGYDFGYDKYSILKTSTS